MNEKKCLILSVGHHSNRLKLSIDKEIFNKIIFIKEREEISGRAKHLETINELNEYYKKQMIETEICEFSFKEQTKAIAELTFIICLQKILNYSDISINISGGLRYMIIWLYIACLITNTRVIHGDFKYNKEEEVGINYNMELVRIPLSEPTFKQYEFLKLFFTSYEDIVNIIKNQGKFSEVLDHIKSYDSIESLKEAYNEIIDKDITRGSVNGYLNQLKKISAIETMVNPENKIEKRIKITYLGIAYVLNFLKESYL